MVGHRKKDNYNIDRPCPYCHRPMTSGKDRSDVPDSQGTWATIEHIITRKNKGTNDPHNLIIVCARCNNLRGHYDYELFCEFAKTVIARYPNTPTVHLRAALKDYIEQLAIMAFKNKRFQRDSLRVVLLSHSENFVK